MAGLGVSAAIASWRALCSWRLGGPKKSFDLELVLHVIDAPGGHRIIHLSGIFINPLPPPLSLPWLIDGKNKSKH